MQHKKGFTLIEVALFLVITGALFAGIVTGVQNSIYQQRMNDSVQSFMEFLRTVYSETMNVQSLGTGRTDRAIYGKLITFGENTNLNFSSDSTNAENNIYVYDVIGDVGEEVGFTSSALSTLTRLNAHVMTKDENGEITLNGIVESYNPRWGAIIQDSVGNPFRGSLLIIRHPNSGVVYTFFADVLEINESRKIGQLQPIDWTVFSLDQVNFCINPNGEQGYPNRPNVRIVENARSGSGVELIPESDETNVCEWRS
ncbi:type II secretion system protein [Candidatus Saccharibacteria bacterium]|nr:type II secretion system protein [Candidatus Saccharibacteria bacterium]